MAIKVIATIRAYFNGEIIKPGTILTIENDNVPSWAQEISSKAYTQEKTENEQSTVIGEQNLQLGEQNNEISNNESKNYLNESEDGQEPLSQKTNKELELILDRLITKGIELGVYLENTENQTIVEQIYALKEEISKAESKQGEK